MYKGCSLYSVKGAVSAAALVTLSYCKMLATRFPIDKTFAVIISDYIRGTTTAAYVPFTIIWQLDSLLGICL